MPHAGLTTTTSSCWPPGRRISCGSSAAGSYRPSVLGAALGLVALTAILLWTRERRMNAQRATLRKTYQLGEDILSSPTPEAASQRIADALPAILGVTRVRLYIHNRGAGTLDEVTAKDGKVVSIPLAPSPDNTQSGAAACFHYRTLLVVPDTARSPFPMVAGGPAGGSAGGSGTMSMSGSGSISGSMPKAQLFVPMMTQGDLVGVMRARPGQPRPRVPPR